MNCLCSQRPMSRVIAKIFFKCRDITVDFGNAVSPVASSNRNIPVTDICAVDLISPFSHIGPGVAALSIGNKGLRGRCRIGGLLINRIEKSCAEEIGVIEAKAIEDKNIFLRLAKLRRFHARTDSSTCSRQRLIGCTHQQLEPLDDLARAVTSVLRSARKILCMLVDRAEELWIEGTDDAHVMR